MPEIIVLPWNANYYIDMYMRCYNKNMSVAESNCIVTVKKYSVEYWQSVYNSITSQCNKLDIDIHSVQFSEKVSEYISCIENYDAVLREKLTVNYIRCCELSKTEFERDVIGNSKYDFSVRTAYSNWLRRFAGERKATEIFLTEVVESDSDNVKNLVPKAQEYKLFFQDAEKRVQEILQSFEIKRKNVFLEQNKRFAEEMARYEKEKREREEAELAEKKCLEEREIKRKSLEKKLSR